MKLYEKAILYIPDGEQQEKAIARTTHLAISAHQDDIEFMAYAPIAECFGKADKWFSGVVVTDGAGSPRSGLYADYTDEEMKEVRITEQKKAAAVGEYSFQMLLGHPSKEVKDPKNIAIVREIAEIIREAKPKYLYTHNLADKHETHVATALKVIAALRTLALEERPEKVKHTCRRCDYSYLSDFVTSGDDGYIGEDEHTHTYIFQMENDEARKCLLISYLCECGKAYDGEIVILFTDAEGIGTVLELAADGTADYSALNGTYRVTITDAEGELLADFELTNGEPEEHVHVYVFELEDNAEDRYFTFRYACACGEAYPGTLYISYTAENGEAGTLTASEEGIVDYSMLEGACHILIETEAEVLYELDLPAVQPPEEHTHAFVLNVSDNTEEKYFSLRYVCECGEVYAGTLQMTYTNEYGETGTLAIDAEGKADYSALAAGTYRIMVSTDTEQISEFELHIAQSPSEPVEPDDNEQDKPGNENGGQTDDKNKGNTPTLAILFVLLGVLAACGVAVFIAKKRKKRLDKTKSEGMK